LGGSETEYLIFIFCHAEHPGFYWYISQGFERETNCIFFYQMHSWLKGSSAVLF